MDNVKKGVAGGIRPFLLASSRVHLHLAKELNGKTFVHKAVFKGLFLLLACPQNIKNRSEFF
ncbi:MAG: hypothetical protein IJ021_06235 [Clostridia bacterium]|nr:hypothetical protein [Clostridia bacterium]